MKLKYHLCLILCAFGLNSMAQNTSGFNYQAVVCNAQNEALTERNITVKFSIIDPELNVVYREYHETKTSKNGFFNLGMGDGKILKGKWDSIPWLNAPLSLKVEIDTLKNNSYFIFSEMPFLTVPYAKYAEKSHSSYLNRDPQGRLSLSLDSAFYVFSSKTPPDTLVAIFPDGRIGLGVANPHDGIVVAPNKRIHLSSEEWHLDKSGVITLQALNDSAKPALSWFDENGKIHAAMTTYDRKRVDSIHNQQFVVETDNGNGLMLPRFAIPYGLDWTEIRTHNSDFRVGDGGNLFVGKINEGGNAFFYGNAFAGQRLGIGKKDWEANNPFSNSNSTVEVYSKNAPAEVLILQEEGTHKAAIQLQRGNNTWEIAHQENQLTFNYNDTTRFVVSPQGKIGIRNNQPQASLDVEGNIAANGSIISSASGYACFFETEETLLLQDVVGINPSTGKARKYKIGDNFLGIVCNNAGIIANHSAEKENSSSWALVALTGEVSVNTEQIQMNNGKALTLDQIAIGYVLPSGKILLK